MQIMFTESLLKKSQIWIITEKSMKSTVIFTLASNLSTAYSEARIITTKTV